MTIARSRLISLDSTPYYHCICRCVRRSFLCGEDPCSGNNYDHRKQWLVDRFHFLSSIFAIDICAYAVMSNHYHIVLHVDDRTANKWSDNEVIERWAKLFDNSVAAAYVSGEQLTPGQKHAIDTMTPVWRERLKDVSWFMRTINEPLARMSNKEDNCTGRFWEGRFKSQALLDEKALLTCMAYVDLNPIRAKITTTPETSDFTSIQARIQQKEEKLMPFQYKKNVERTTDEEVPVIPFALQDYFLLVDATGRILCKNKRGSIPNKLKSILERIGVEEKQWVNNVEYFNSRFHRAVGTVASLKGLAENLGQKWMKGMSGAKMMYGK